MATPMVSRPPLAVKLTVNQARQLDQSALRHPALLAQIEAQLLKLPARTGRQVVGRIIGQGLAQLLDRPAPPPGEAVCDLIIATKKYGYGSTTSAAAPILWWKVAGRPKDEIYRRGLRLSLTDPVIQKRLADYELVRQKVGPTEIRRWYKKVVK